jgi:ataxia telangiectasia mutated family protein
MEDTQAIYVKIALKMYASALSMSDQHDDSVTRMCALWLEQGKDREVEVEDSSSMERQEELDQERHRREEICKDFASPVSKIPSYKFIFLGPQLAARLDKPKETFNDSLNKLISRVSSEHPYHILYQIIPLASGAVTLPAKSRRVSEIKVDETDGGAASRAEAAENILKSLGADTTRAVAGRASKQMKMFAEAATTWCLYKDKVEEAASISKELKLPNACPLAAMQNLSLPIPTCPPSIDLTCRYEGIPTLMRYRGSYSVLGGIHRPKKMQAVDSLGQRHRQLVSIMFAVQLC